MLQQNRIQRQESKLPKSIWSNHFDKGAKTFYFIFLYLYFIFIFNFYKATELTNKNIT